jgi:hydroxyacylglutathione hydrolase
MTTLEENLMIQYRAPHLTVFQSALYQTTSTVLETDDLVLVVDPNWLAEEVYEIQTHVNKNRGQRPVYLLFTHSDWDHIIGYNAFPDAICVGTRELQDSPKRVRKVEQINEFDSQNYIVRNYPIEFPNLDIMIEHDGQQLKVGNTTLTFYKSPGHTDDGMFTIVEEMGIFIAGDYLSNVEYPFIYHNSHAYETTMHKVDEILAKHPIHLLIPGHGSVTTDVQEIQKRKQDSLDYILQMREAIQANDEAAMERLIAHYSFVAGQKLFQQGNIELFKKELASK